MKSVETDQLSEKKDETQPRRTSGQIARDSISNVLSKLIHRDAELRAENFKLKVNVVKNLEAEKHDEANNRMMLPHAIGNTFTKAGLYIFSLGTVSFLEVISTNLLCFIYCFFLE